MAITTVAVTCTAFGQDGNPIAGAIFKATLDKVEIYEGMVVPQVTTATTNSSGIAILNLWPNELGIRGSSYFVTGTYPGAASNFLEETAVIQNDDCNLEDAIQIETAPPLIPAGHVGAGGVVNHALVVAGGAAGFMSGEDKTKLNSIAPSATANPTTDTLAEGSTNQWFTMARVRATVLTGYTTVASAAVAATDTVLQAIQKLQAQFADKVDKVAGKQLSTEDYSTAEKSKLAGVATGATANSSDATLLARANHTGTQAISTVAGLQAELDAKPNITLVSGLIPSAYLPSYVDDVLEFANLAAFPATGETGKMYVALDTGKIWRWSGSAYVEISASPGSTDAVTEGATNLYFTVARVLAAVLSGLSTATSTAITAADTVLSALGKLQAQITLRATLVSPTFTGTPLAPTAAAATNTTQVATTAFTQAALSAWGVGTLAATLASDADTIAGTGFYRLSSSSTNGPTASEAYTLTAVQVSSSSAFHLAARASASSVRIFARTSSGGSFTTWREYVMFSATGKLTYGPAAGVGGAVTQTTSKSTGVTLNNATGQITLNASSLASNTTESFTLTNSLITANDQVIVHRKSGGTAGSYVVGCDSVAAGSCVIYIRNTTGGALAESVVLQFSLLGGLIA